MVEVDFVLVRADTDASVELVLLVGGFAVDILYTVVRRKGPCTRNDGTGEINDRFQVQPINGRVMALILYVSLLAWHLQAQRYPLVGARPLRMRLSNTSATLHR